MMTVCFTDSCTGQLLIVFWLSLILDVVVRFVEVEYSVTENGNRQEVCTELAGRSQIPVSVSLVTIDGSATSKLHNNS